MKYVDEFRNPAAARAISAEIERLAMMLPEGRIFTVMEVCGSHTMAIARYALKELLPSNIRLISGPGCPVCVTDSGYIDAALELAGREDTVIVTFGDMINVPGEGRGVTLARARSEGADIRVAYSPMNAVELAEKYPDREIIFLGIGFETTTAPVISVIDTAIRRKITNLSLLTAFKLVPPALEALIADPEINVDAFLCPAHVSAVIGADAYEPFVAEHKIPCVIASFEPVDIIFGIQKIIEQLVEKNAFVDNQYTRVVKPEGNRRAQEIMNKYLEPADAAWRGLGVIPMSGMRIRQEFAEYDTEHKFSLKVQPGKIHSGCRCGDVLKGKITPEECAMFADICTPLNPVGPCMVSSEGACAASYKYR